jgi:FKBP-type peptidyl-prolyl cis-trans isomerase
MTKKRDRAFAMFGALLFLITSSALTIAVIWQVSQSNDTAGNTTTDSSASPTPVYSQNPSPPGYEQLTASTNLTGAKMESFTPTSTRQTQLQTEDIVVGTGATVQAGATVTADYVGALMGNGTIFDASANHGGPQTFPLSGVIAGWSQGIPGMKVGGTRRLLIPSGLAYGSHATSGIPADSDLVFDVTVVAVQ